MSIHAGKVSRFATMLLMATWLSLATSFALYVGPPWQAAGAAAAAAPLIAWLVLAMQRKGARSTQAASAHESLGTSKNHGSVNLGLLAVAALQLTCGFGLILSQVAGNGSYLQSLSEALVSIGTLVALLVLARLIARTGKRERSAG
jgi:hypothetical protein